MAAVFSRKPAYTAAAPALEGDGADLRARVLAAAANPYIGASAAAFLFLLSLAVLVLITGDPKAGAPVLRFSLSKIGATKGAPDGWREALGAEGAEEAPLLPGQMDLSTQPFARQVASEETPDGRPRVALVIGGLGLNAQTTRAAIETLPPEITLSFAPYAEGLQGWIDLARSHGHEVLLETPMEPNDYPANDPGPYTLIAANRPDETVRKLEWLMSRATGYFGLTNYLGSKFLASDPAMATFTTALKSRGLAFIDDGAAARRGGPIPRASAERGIDDDLSGEAIEGQLRALESGASARGQALGVGFAYPVTISQVRNWAGGLNARGVQLAPASAIAKR